MYQVKCDDTIIYNDISLSKDIEAYSPTLNIADNKAGSFKVTLPKNNTGYDKITKMVSTISISKDNNWVWEGRVIKESTNFHNQKTIECEGALSYLNDVSLPPKTYKANTPRKLIDDVLTLYNSRAKSNRKIYIGTVTVTGDPDIVEYESNYESVLSFLEDNLLSRYNGHMFITKEANKLKLNYYNDWIETCTQTIDFGSNLLDFTRDYDFTKICTVCIPRGAQLSDDDNFDGTSDEKINPSSKNKYLTVETVNNGSIYIESNLVSTYGRIEKVVDFSDVDDPTLLLKMGKTYMSALQFEDLSMTVKAVDLHVLNPSIQSFKLLDRVRCVSLPHGLDKEFPITAIDIPLNNPDNVTYTMGGSSGGITTSVTTTNSQIKATFDKVSTRESVLKEAFKNAEAVLNTKTNGFVNIVDTGEYSQALIISSGQDWASSDNYWKFDVTGLGYYSEGNLKEIAITMDGSINANFITTGTLSADRIRSGTITDNYNNNSINLETGEIYLSSDKSYVTDGEGGKYTLGSINENLSTITQQTAVFKTDITGLQSDVKSLEASYGTCSSGSYEVIKNVICKNFKLKKGATVIVKFIFKNAVSWPKLNVNGTGAYYIYINGDRPLSFSKENWEDDTTVSFVYTGDYWTMSNGVAESHIRQLADSISLSVTGKLGTTASIVLNADGKQINKTLDMSGVRNAFKNDPSSIVVSAGTITFNSNTFILNATNCSITSNGYLTATSASFKTKIEIAQTSRYIYDMVGDVEYAVAEEELNTNDPALALSFGRISITPSGLNFWQARRIGHGGISEWDYGLSLGSIGVNYDDGSLRINFRHGVYVNGHAI